MSITASAQGVPDPSLDDLGLFNLSSQTRRSQTARDPISTLDSSRSRSQQSDNSRSDQFQLALQLKAFLILAQTISACSTPARKQDDLRQLATRSARWTARVPDLSNQTARENISSRSDQFQLALQLKAFLILAQTISACSTSARKQDDLRQLATRSARCTARVPDLSNQTARDNISSRSDQFQLAVHLFGCPFNPT
ncbi:hypothetical protein F2Q70_00022833 [Brassica cretica]|uniref:Uncharacterized protein n=1 Tax=Brassica cretica TaxID=69181 RepID=A0A8S9GJT7_BRACR|nr:hypothetical protein F2Q70_00022833 [Brassica cretica]